MAVHGTLTRTLHLAASPRTVFEAFSVAEKRRLWFRMPGNDRTHEIDFREGGAEVAGSTFPGTNGPEVLAYSGRFIEIVADHRISYQWELRINDELRMIGLSTIEITGVDCGARYDYLEQYQVPRPIADGSVEIAEREGSSRLQLNGLKAVVEGAL